MRLLAIAIVLAATTLGSLQLFARPGKGGGCMNACMGGGGGVAQCRSICGR
jgi:hypothetical protein